MRNSVKNKIEVLKLASWLLLNKGWVKNSHGAVDKYGNDVETLSADAVRWSLEGAIRKAEQLVWCNSTYSSEAYEYVRAFLKREFKVDFICEFNDHPVVEFEDVVILLERCIEELEFVL